MNFNHIFTRKPKDSCPKKSCSNQHSKICPRFSYSFCRTWPASQLHLVRSLSSTISKRPGRKPFRQVRAIQNPAEINLQQSQAYNLYNSSSQLQLPSTCPATSRKAQFFPGRAQPFCKPSSGNESRPHLQLQPRCGGFFDSPKHCPPIC